MRKQELVTSMTRSFRRAGLKLKKHSPELLLAAGVVTGVAGAVMACKATLKVHDILDEAKENLDAIHECVEHPEDLKEEYTVEDSKRDTAIVYTQTGVKLAKLYGPAVILGVTSIGCVLASHNIIHKRNVALAAAYSTIDKSFKEYRGRVIERFGKDLDRELKYNIKAVEVEERVVDENGNESTVTKTIEVTNPHAYSGYAKVFDETCVNWEKDAELNRYFLEQIQNWANDKLKVDGFLFLNDVYHELGFQKTKAGQCVGWVYNEKNPVGDNYVDFGIYDIYSEPKRRFINGYERSIILDFNVDGDILDLI
jgi:hypothetical protein